MNERRVERACMRCLQEVDVKEQPRTPTKTGRCQGCGRKGILFEVAKISIVEAVDHGDFLLPGEKQTALRIVKRDGVILAPATAEQLRNAIEEEWERRDSRLAGHIFFVQRVTVMRLGAGGTYKIEYRAAGFWVTTWTDELPNLLEGYPWEQIRTAKKIWLNGYRLPARPEQLRLAEVAS